MSLAKPYKILLYQTASNTHLFFLYYIRFVFQKLLSLLCNLVNSKAFTHYKVPGYGDNSSKSFWEEQLILE